ncbi:MAG: aspartokinase/homoserine dehydrogenase 1 [Moritella sp.]|jgi:aspartokinase/homoserine dehydrogenase 1
MRVLKFGGTSLANAERFSCAADISVSNLHQSQVALVLSAPAKVTNNLVAAVQQTVRGLDAESSLNEIESIFQSLIAGLKSQHSNYNDTLALTEVATALAELKLYLTGVKLLGQCPENIEAKILCTGEKLSIVCMEQLLLARHFNVVVIVPQEKLVGKGSVLEASVDIDASRARFMQDPIKPDHIYLMPGFTAGDEQGETVVLGRNGSDYSAAVLAACLQADCCEIWTDVDGVYACDPRLVKDAKLLKTLSYPEAMELSYFGAKVLHPKTIAPLALHHIPCLIKNTQKPQGEGTLIGGYSSQTQAEVKSLSELSGMTMINVSGPGMKGMVGMAGRIFEAVSRAGVSIALITQSSSEYSVSFCIHSYDASKARIALNTEFDLEIRNQLLEPIEMRDGLAIISLVGDGMRKANGIAARFFTALAQASVNLVAIAQGSSERSISAVIDETKANEAIKASHQIFFGKQQYIELFLLGCGGVGAALVEQVKRQKAFLAKRQIEIRVCGIANSRQMLLDPEGLDLTNWEAALDASNIEFSINHVSDLVTNSHIINPVIVDCTSNDDLASQYVDFLGRGFHVVAANKKANTMSMDYYQQLRSTALKTRRRFLYDTNVGAGLPVIENLQNLLSAGDELVRFNGILSGSMSYIFGKLDEGMSFSQATSQARDNGFTEPDPREDLSGMDIARKLLIIAREAGMNLTLDQVEVEAALPSDFDASGTNDEFMAKLPQADAYFADLQAEAAKSGKVLRYIGQIEDGKCRVSIAAVPESDPLNKVKDGENALAFYSRYYQPIPMVLRGYGAGSEVTAAGVFADVLRTLNWKQEV